MSSTNSSCGDNFKYSKYLYPSWDKMIFVIALVLVKQTWEFLSLVLYLLTSFFINTTSLGQNRLWNYWVMNSWKTGILGSIFLYKHALSIALYLGTTYSSRV